MFPLVAVNIPSSIIRVFLFTIISETTFSISPFLPVPLSTLSSTIWNVPSFVISTEVFIFIPFKFKVILLFEGIVAGELILPGL